MAFNVTVEGVEDLLRKVYFESICAATEPPCEERRFYRIMMGNGFFLVLCLAMFGNCINLITYNSEQIRYYIAIRMLCTRILTNSFAMLFLVPQGLRVIGAWEPNSRLDHIYWAYYPYQAYFVNVFGFCAMWLTVLMIGECYLHIFLPCRSKMICTRKNLSKSYMVISTTALILALIYPFNRRASIEVDTCDRVVVNIEAAEGKFITLLERLHAISNLLLSIVLPMCLLVFMTSSIVCKLLFRKGSTLNTTAHFTAEKKCVTRITLITTGLQLVAELPLIPVFILATVSGPSIINDQAVCIWNTIGMFLGLCNMSLSFYVYVTLSQKFREMVVNRLCTLKARFFKSSGNLRRHLQLVCQFRNNEQMPPSARALLPDESRETIQTLASFKREESSFLKGCDSDYYTDSIALHELSTCALSDLLERA